MRFVIEENSESRLFYANSLSNNTTISDLLLLANLDQRLWEEIWVDSKEVKPNARLFEIPLLEGSTIANHAPNWNLVDSDSDFGSDSIYLDYLDGISGESKKSAAWRVLVTGGSNSGESYQLSEGEVLRVGRSPDTQIVCNSPLVSWSHCALIGGSDGVLVKDDHSSNGTYVNGVKISPAEAGLVAESGSVLTLGNVSLRVEKVEPEPGYATTNHIKGTYKLEFNRPPRNGLPGRPDKIAVPKLSSPQKAGKFAWVPVVLPLLMAGGMVAITGSFRFALFALLSPVSAVLTWIVQKRRAKKSEEEVERQYVEDLQEFAENINHSAEVERNYLDEKIPDIFTCLDRIVLAAPQLWQVRGKDSDFLCARLGIGRIPFAPSLDSDTASSKLEERANNLYQSAHIDISPIEVDFQAGVVGIWGDREAALGIARSLILQLATNSGPADISMGVFTDKANADNWRWCAWLPHFRQGGTNLDNLWMGLEFEYSKTLLNTLKAQLENTPTNALLLVIDALALFEGRENVLRDIFDYTPPYSSSGRKIGLQTVSGIVIASHHNQLPAICNTVIEAKADGEAVLTIPKDNWTIEEIISSPLSSKTAEKWVRQVARYEDPEVLNPAASLPDLVNLLELLGLTPQVSGKEIISLWKKFRNYSVPLGVDQNGIHSIDLVKDGPHGLVGGTTGSGKSELLRSLVAGLAVRISPEFLTFILVDFKGGAAFASLDQLPHTIGTLSNLDPALAKRAIDSLVAEMRYRQEKFAAAGKDIDNLDAYLATNPREPLPRLLLVVDEFAQLAKEYPEVLSSLVQIGAVGRTLGIHMILATQRPEGVINDDILANTNLRVALRVQGRSDSNNIIGIPDAANIGRTQKGRAYIKLGQSDITAIQTALITGKTADLNQQATISEVRLAESAPEIEKIVSNSSSASDLDLLIEAIKCANRELGYQKPRPVWPEPLGEKIVLEFSDLGELDSDATSNSIVGADSTAFVREESDDEVTSSSLAFRSSLSSNLGITRISPLSGSLSLISVGVSDDPEHQLQYVMGWELDKGNLLLVGAPGTGTSTTLTSLAISAAYKFSPEECNFIFIEFSGNKLGELSGLPHVTDHIRGGSNNRESQQRALRFLITEFEKRSAQPGNYPKLMIFIDSLMTSKLYDDLEWSSLIQRFYQVWASGSSVGIHCVATVISSKGLPSAITDVTKQKWVFNLVENYDYTMMGIDKNNPPQSVPGRCVVAESKHHTQIAIPEITIQDTIFQVDTRWPNSQQASLIGSIPDRVEPSELKSKVEISGGRIKLPVGIREQDLSEYCLELFPGEHVLISGTARSGKSSVLLAIAEKFTTDCKGNADGVEIDEVYTDEMWTEEVAVYAVASARSPFMSLNSLQNAKDDLSEKITVFPHNQLNSCLAAIEAEESFVVLLIDDATMLDGNNQILMQLLKGASEDVLIVAAGRNDDLRSQYGTWIAELKKSKTGLLLQPDTDFDGSILGAQIPRRSPVTMTTARGYVVANGQSTLIQAMTKLST